MVASDSFSYVKDRRGASFIQALGDSSDPELVAIGIRMFSRSPVFGEDLEGRYAFYSAMLADALANEDYLTAYKAGVALYAFPASFQGDLPDLAFQVAFYASKLGNRTFPSGDARSWLERYLKNPGKYQGAAEAMLNGLGG